MKIKYWMKAKITKWFYEWLEWVILEEIKSNYIVGWIVERTKYTYWIQLDLWEWKQAWPYLTEDYFEIIN